MTTAPRRILLVISSLAAGGAERMIVEMASWWAQHGREVAVLTLSGTDQDHYSLPPEVQRISLDFFKRARTPWQAIKKRVRRLLLLRKECLRFNPHIVISFVTLTNIRLLTALAGTGIRVIVSERIDPRQHPIGPFWTLVRKLAYPYSAALVVQTQAVVQWAQKIVPGDKISVIPNFVRTLNFSPQPGTAVHDQPLVLAVGRLDRQKGHDLLLRAFAATKGAQGGWRLVILGEGPERARLESLGARLDLGQALEMPGIVDEPAEWMRAAGLFVLPSRYEGFPNALLEAMAVGCAVIAADCPSGPAKIIHHGENGLLVPREDHQALTGALLRLMNDKPLRERLGNEALEVRSRFARETIMPRWDAVIDRITATQV